MTWLTWRQFRVQALSVFAALAAVVVVLAITGPDLVGRTSFTDVDFLFGGTMLLMYLLPAALGAFWGVPMVARELETGTHSLVWNQTVTRRRWLATKLGTGVLAATVAAALLSVAVTWWASPIDALASAERQSSMLNRMAPPVFGARGIVPVGYAVFAFVLGVAAGIVLRRTMAAMAVTLVAFAAVLLAVPFLVRPYVLPPTDETVPITEQNLKQIIGDESGVLEAVTVEEPAGAWVLTNETVDASGDPVRPLPAEVQHCIPAPGEGEPPDRQSVVTCVSQLGDLGYQQQLTYQPGSRFWPLQWMETGLYLLLSAALSWFCFRHLRRLS
ncbi:transporter [Actinophytocola gossypii]|uniref:Transporter n=1 Tax=Actinophytocola gossypii TaxID=2812003 RepID=A0ABT2JIZ2_9PSEU|nr:transporter [Actinophytocola gossypii]MCT2587847.1 transporter [Actinophytocola gossypii]